MHLVRLSTLHRAGFRLLHLDGKAPVGPDNRKLREWTSLPPQPFPEWLAARPSPTANVGVALGGQSPLYGGGFLACLDIDLKDASPDEVRSVMRLAIEFLGESGLKAPRVKSGQGYHLYFKTTQPFKSKTLARSPRQIENPNGTKSAAWELAAYSTGRQMVLPPSIHPLTGENYSWIIPPKAITDFPLVDFESMRGADAAVTKSSHGMHSAAASVLPIPFDPQASLESFKARLSNHHYYAIKTLNKVTDKSLALYVATQALYRAGASHAQINGILMSDENEISVTMRAHTHSDDFATNLRWLDKYNVQPALSEIKNRMHFEAVARDITPAEPEPLEIDTTAAQQMGFMSVTKNGAVIPDYAALLAYFEEEQGELVVSAEEEEVFQWRGRHYVKLNDREIEAFAEENFNPAPSQTMRKEFAAKVGVTNVMSREMLDTSGRNKISFLNGVLDTRTMEFLDHSPSRFIRGHLPYDYSPDARAPLFEKWIDGLMIGDKDLVAALQEFLGYIVEGGPYVHHKMLWLSGVGRNGKSTFIDVMKALIGRQNYISASLAHLMNDKFMSAMLDGKLLCASEEVNPGDFKDSGLVKTLTGDGEITAQRKFKPAFDMTNRAKLVWSLNELPQLSDLTPGMLSRIIIIPFNRFFADSEQDKTIKQKLFDELPGIFNWALDGMKRLQKNGAFTTAAASREALEKVEHDSSSVAQWAAVYLIQGDDGDFVPSSELYLHYRKVVPYPSNMTTFFKRMAKLPGLQGLYHRKAHSNGYRNIKLNLGFS